MKQTKAIVQSKSVPTAKGAAMAVEHGLAIFAQQLSAPLIKPATLARTIDRLKTWADAIEDLQKVAKQKTLELLEKQGETVTEKGTKRAVVDGLQFEARPHRTGVDPKKLEALLRAKKLDVAAYMDATISYKVNESRLPVLISDNRLTQAELDSCNYDTTWVVQPPKVVETEED